MSDQTPPMAAEVCDHFWVGKVRGGEPVSVEVCQFCGAIDWKDLREQVERQVREAVAGRSGDRPEWMCLVCMYVTPPPGIGSPEELEVLTVANGQLVCMRHVPCAKDTRHDTIMSGVDFESQGTIRGLEEYQRWRATQSDEGATA